MTGIVLSVLLSAVSPEAGPAGPGVLGEQPVLSIDPCVGADADAVSELLDIELGPAPALGPNGPQSITVRCLDDGEEIRVEPWASLGSDGIRAIQLPPLEPSAPATREGRARELALAIAELVRRLEATHPLAPPEPPAPPPPPPIVVAPPPPPPEQPGRWQVGVLSSAEYFGGGASLVGVDLVFARRLGTWLMIEARAGGRAGPDNPSPLGLLTDRAAVGSAAAGLCHRHRSVEFGLAVRAEGFLVQLRDDFATGGSARSADLGAVALEAEPRFSVAVGRPVWIQVAAGVGSTLHGILVRTQGIETKSMTGLFASGSLGAGIAF